MNISNGSLRSATCLLVVLVATAAGAAAPMHPAGIQGEVQLPRSPSSDYRLNPSDVFEVDFRFTPELNQSVTVRPDGYITLHSVGDVQAAGLTVPEVTLAIRRAYSSVLRDPSISVSLKDFRKPYVIVDGEVARPGQYELRGGMTLSEAIAIAGGFRESAKASEVLIFRRLRDGSIQRQAFNVKRERQGASLDAEPRVDESDVIFVPRNTWSKVRQFIPIPSIGFYPFR